jgi:hypothetical protein
MTAVILFIIHKLREEPKMKKIMSILIIALFTLSLTGYAFAGGDQNQGDKGQGQVKRIQVTVKK